MPFLKTSTLNLKERNHIVTAQFVWMNLKRVIIFASKEQASDSKRICFSNESDMNIGDSTITFKILQGSKDFFFFF